MRKFFVIYFALFLVLFAVGCNGDNTVKLESLTLNRENFAIVVDETAQLSVTAQPKGASARVNWNSSNPEVATVSDTGLVTGKSPGKATITATSKVDSKISVSVEVTVTELSYDDPESLEITTRDSMALHSTFSITFEVFPETAKQEVEFSSSDETVATVSENGLVLAKGLGTTTITVTVVANPEISRSFTLEVTESGDITKPTSIVINGEREVEEGGTIQFSATVYPLGVNQDVIWSLNSETYATISENGRLTALKQGSVYVIATSAVDDNVMEMALVTIKAKKAEEPYPDLEQYVIKIMAASHATHEHDPFLEKYVGVDKAAKQQIWRAVEDNFNCKLEVVAYPDAAPWGPQRVSWIIQKATTGEAEADIFVAASEWTKELVEGGACYDLSEYYHQYGKNQMSNALKAAATYKGGIYAFPAVSAASINVEKGIFYNVNLLTSLGIESPAIAFNEGRWTYTDFYNYMLEVQSKLGDEQYAITGEPSKYWIGVVNAGGVKLADTITLSVNVLHQYSFQAAEVLRDLYEAGAWDPASDSWEVTTAFSESRAVFQHGEYWFVKTDNRFKPNLWGDGTTKYGFVPFPYPNGFAKSATRTYNAGGHFYILGKGREYPSNVTAKDIYRAYTTVLLETKQYLEQDQSFDEEQQMRNQAQSRLDDPDSIEALLFFGPDKAIFDPIELLDPLWKGGSLGGALRSVVISGDDFHETLAPHIPRLEIELMNTYG
ncbi:MAG: extracellular solute-binding protein [Bacilli bacterium]